MATTADIRRCRDVRSSAFMARPERDALCLLTNLIMTNRLNRTVSLDGQDALFPAWPKGAGNFREEDQTYVDPEAIPAEMRTRGEHTDHEDGGFHTIEPVTILRRAFVGVFAEIVRIDYWIGIKEDGCGFYQVNLVSPINLGFDRSQNGTVSLDYNLGCGFSEFTGVVALLADAERFIKWHRKRFEVPE
jgi:hypothetical protein